MSKLFDPTLGAIGNSLNFRLLNQNVISSNIANADTPGYKAKKVEFEGALQEALAVDRKVDLEGTDPKHMVRMANASDGSEVSPEIFDDPNGIESMDGNTVNMTTEMSRQAENQLMYDASIELMKKKLGMLKYAITEGGGNR